MTDPLLEIRPGDRWLVAVAHPDDETFGCGSLIAEAARHGAHVTVLCATRGEAGERTPEIPDDADLGAVREAELHAAAALLGVARVRLLDYGDSGFDGEPLAGTLCGSPLAEVTATLAAELAAAAPSVVVILDGSDGHRDHLRMKAGIEAAVAGIDTAPLVVQTCLPNSIMRRWLDEMRETHPDAAYHGIDPAQFGTPDALVTDVLDHSDVLGLREAAIALHRSQRSPYDELSPDLRRAFLADTYVIR